MSSGMRAGRDSTGRCACPRRSRTPSRPRTARVRRPRPPSRGGRGPDFLPVQPVLPGVPDVVPDGPASGDRDRAGDPQPGAGLGVAEAGGTLGPGLALPELGTRLLGDARYRAGRGQVGIAGGRLALLAAAGGGVLGHYGYLLMSYWESACRGVTSGGPGAGHACWLSWPPARRRGLPAPAATCARFRVLAWRASA